MGLRDYRPEQRLDVAGETVLIRGLTVGQAEQLAEQVGEADAVVTFQRHVVAVCTYTEAGEPYFGGADEVKQVHRGVMQQLFDAALDVSGLAEKAVEQAEKN